MYSRALSNVDRNSATADVLLLLDVWDELLEGWVGLLEGWEELEDVEELARRLM